jgi:Spy/CpxP family protein refolding chaperone
MKKFLVFSLAVVLLAGLFGLSNAMMQGKGAGMGKNKGMANMHMGDMGMHDGQMMEKLASLGLDDKQMEEIRGLHLKTKKETIKKEADIEVAEIELKEMLHKDTVDINAAEAKVRQIESLKSDLKIMHIRTHEEVKSKLTPEQRKKFNAMIMKMKPMCNMNMGEKCRNCDMMKDDGNVKAPAGKGRPAPPAAGHKH